MSHFEDVKEFHEKFNLLVSKKPVNLTKRKLIERVECMREELDEFIVAAGLYEHDGQLVEKPGTPQDLEHQADALVDLVYFALGTAAMIGLPWKKLWKDVHRANMAKVRGVSHRNHAVDCVKPKGWVPPQGQKILLEAGYTGYNGEEFCCDDAVDQ